MSIEAAQISAPPVAQEAASPPLNFWRQPIVQDWLPLATSLAFHLILLVVGLISYAAYKRVTTPTREQLIIPEAAMVEGAKAGGLPNPGLGGDPNLAAAQNSETNVAADQTWEQKRSDSLSLTSSLLASANDPSADSVIGLGAHSGLSSVRGSATGGGESGSGALAPFGVPGGGSELGLKSTFMGVGGNARRIIYICDASGSMMSVFPRVQAELRRSVDILKPIQAFNVIFFSDVEITAMNNNGLVMATPDNKRKAFDLAAKMSAAGTTDPLPAIRMALAQKPQLVYVLTDGFDQIVSFDSVIKEFRKLNADKSVKVNTILLRSADNPELERVVRVIAQENGGVCRIVDRQDM